MTTPAVYIQQHPSATTHRKSMVRKPRRIHAKRLRISPETQLSSWRGKEQTEREVTSQPVTRVAWKQGLRGVAAGPLAGRRVELLAVALVHLRHVRHQRIVRVRVRQQRAHRQQHLADRQRRRPLVLQDVQADAAVGVDVRVEDLRRELQARRLERVVGREVDVEEEEPARVRRVLGTDDGRLPVEQVALRHRPGRRVRRRVLLHVAQLLLDAAEGHGGRVRANQ
mmetsp:Transcript_50040/g.154611  ORF Transcript_50040/g.154611 Transcript_50040/m.154611 type:complete len:225 (-) Transcript_50040:18-692(-)